MPKAAAIAAASIAAAAVIALYITAAIAAVSIAAAAAIALYIRHKNVKRSQAQTAIPKNVKRSQPQTAIPSPSKSSTPPPAVNFATEWLDEDGRVCPKNVDYATQCSNGHHLMPLGGGSSADLRFPSNYTENVSDQHPTSKPPQPPASSPASAPEQPPAPQPQAVNFATEWLDEDGRVCPKNVDYATQCPKGHHLMRFTTGS
jgi:hypothetical protein